MFYPNLALSDFCGTPILHNILAVSFTFFPVIGFQCIGELSILFTDGSGQLVSIHYVLEQ